MTTVVHVRDVRARLKAGDPDVVYIGRANYSRTWRRGRWTHGERMPLPLEVA